MAVLQALTDWAVKDNVVAMGFDTTGSNTGVHRGGCTILQQLLCRQLLWLACRHHIPERILGAAFFALFGETTGPDVPLFKDLQRNWDTLDHTDMQLTEIPALYKRDVPDLLLYITTRLLPENAQHLPRGDYKEYLELACLFLGGSIDRQGDYTYQLKRPGTVAFPYSSI